MTAIKHHRRKPSVKKPRFSPKEPDSELEATLYRAADKLRSTMDASQYKHIVLGLIFLKCVSDRESDSRSSLCIPPEARWSHLQASSDMPIIGDLLREAMLAIERENVSLRDVLPKDFAVRSLDPQRLGELVRLIGQLGLEDKHGSSRDLLGRVYEYFLARFAAAEGKNGGQFYTPQCVVELLVDLLAPFKGTVFDPCCGSGGIFVQSEKFVRAQGGQVGDVQVYGQESNHTTWRLAKLNLAMRGIEANIAWNDAGSFQRDAYLDLKADYILSNPPFNDGDWGQERLREDPRWIFGTPPSSNANFAWVQHFIHHLAPRGFAGFVLANGTMSSSQSGEGQIRRAIVEADLLDCMIALPAQLFYSTQIPVCIWVLAKNKASRGLRDRRGQSLFIDARELGCMVDRVHAQLHADDIRKIRSIYHAWRGDGADLPYADLPGFARTASLAEIRAHKYNLVPGRYVGFAARPESDLDLMQLKGEVQQLLDRFEQVEKASQAALGILRELFDG